ncbi:hypothetical protein N7495_005402 [Penicillium taxi]|uniref:uncharacterized protein n=1 Tax=Penicillium taxi TaxID=168475 RepID=UPI002545B813|nr:uncharacterized protein N7495_005402 [Penicillium taxi]KAJ5893711.1 hypothetical protein N7495_005402 [Penicillium taxi]
MISSWFVGDLVLERDDAKVKHVIHAIGTSSHERGKEFKAKHCPNQNPIIYNSYEGVYNDKDVDIVYIGTPHAFHYRDSMAAITAGKNVLCEKAFTMNASQAKELIKAAKEKNVYISEAMWLRHRPLVRELVRVLHEEKAIGNILRAFTDFSSGVGDIASLPPDSRYRDLALGAGALLDIGVYVLTWITLALRGDASAEIEIPQIMASQIHEEGIEITTSAVLHYPSTGRHGIATCTTKELGRPGEIFAVIYGTEGCVEVEGRAPSIPESFTVWPKQLSGESDRCQFPREKYKGKRYDFTTPGRGFTYEADNVALDVLEGRKESRIIPWAETVHVMEIMDEIRRQGGTVYPGE